MLEKYKTTKRSHPNPEEIELKIAGMKEMITSQRQREVFQCAYFKAIPLYGYDGIKLIGTQLIINNNMDNTDGHMIINFVDDNFDET